MLDGEFGVTGDAGGISTSSDGGAFGGLAAVAYDNFGENNFEVNVAGTREGFVKIT